MEETAQRESIAKSHKAPGQTIGEHCCRFIANKRFLFTGQRILGGKSGLVFDHIVDPYAPVARARGL